MSPNFTAFLEDRQAAQGAPAAWCFDDFLEQLTVVDLASLEHVLARIEAEPAWTVLALDYELGYLLEPHAAPEHWRPTSGRPLARFWRFRNCRPMAAAAADEWLATRRSLQPAGCIDWQAGISESAYLDAVQRIQSLIAAGDCYQVNFTFPLEFTCFGRPLDLYARLRERQPVRYGGFIGDARSGIVSLSPELFLERHGERLLTRPMKGTAPRSVDASVLAASAKDRAENLMIVDLLRNDLGRIARNGSVRVERLFAIEDYPTVWQMVSEISADISGRSFREILQALFPCGSITGAPKIRAMQIIGELEAAPRGLYTGALGWLAPDGGLRLNVAIRTLEIDADGKGRMGIGSGIVADSDAAAEWRECLLKASFLTGAAHGVALIETLRREDGVYPRLSGHLARLRHSARCFGFPLDETLLRQKLDALPARGLWRVRVLLAQDGHLSVEAFVLAAEPAGARQAELATQAIDSHHPLRRHKTTDRAMYDAALQRCADDQALFDVVFLNERGEVAEGARSNLFVERAGRLLTPPLSSGALPGVLRAELLASGQASEAVLWPTDLANGFYLGNALRGLVAVSLRSTA